MLLLSWACAGRPLLWTSLESKVLWFFSSYLFSLVLFLYLFLINLYHSLSLISSPNKFHSSSHGHSPNVMIINNPSVIFKRSSINLGIKTKTHFDFKTLPSYCWFQHKKQTQKISRVKWLFPSSRYCLFFSHLWSKKNY